MSQGHNRKQEYEKVSRDRTREEMIYAVLSLKAEVDRRVTRLVNALDDLPAVYPCSSCGGHKDLENRENPVPEGYFYVQFIVEPTEEGFLSLGIIDMAARNTDNAHLIVKVLNVTDNPKLVMFHIMGKNGVDPDEVAKEIRSLCKTWGLSLQGVREYKRGVRRWIAYERMRSAPGQE